MALSILDGNQSATTLSTILSSGQHITAHTVVSLGTQAITDMRGAVSGSVVSISNLPSIQTIAGTVTANGGDGTFLVGGLRSGGKTALQLDTGTGYLQTKVESLPSLVAGTAQIGSVTASVTNSVTVGAIVSPIGGSVFKGSPTTESIRVLPYFSQNGSANYNELSTSNPFPIAGTVTIGVGTSQIGSVTASISNSLTISSLPAISGTVTANVAGNLNNTIEFYDDSSAEYVVGVHIKDAGNNILGGGTPLAISGTVTANSSNGSLTTRFGSVTTANTAFATSAVTNANRKYLLIQNITTASNVITVGIGFTPTTTQGIQLFAGAGLTFEGSYIPTGAVNLLSSVTASCYTILEA